MKSNGLIPMAVRLQMICSFFVCHWHFRQERQRALQLCYNMTITVLSS